MRRFLARLSGLSRAQLTRLMGQWLRHRRIEARQPRRHRFPRRYTPQDIALLATVDAAHEGLSGPAVRRILEREYQFPFRLRGFHCDNGSEFLNHRATVNRASSI